MNEQREKYIEELRTASPLEATHLLQEIELYDAKSSQEIIDEVYEQFVSGENMTEEIVKPVFMSVVDSLLESTSFGKTARKKGLTASRVLKECETFAYDNNQNHGTNVDGYVDTKNANVFKQDFGNNIRTEYTNNRDIFDNGQKDKYKAKIEKENQMYVNVVDEYTGQRNIYIKQKHADGRRNDPQYRFQAQTDHIIPLAKIHEQLSGNFALTDEDIATIGNIDANFALTAAYINQGIKGKGGKEDLTISEFIEDQRRREKNGEEHLDLSEETKQKMLLKEKEATKSVEKYTNKLVKENLTGANGWDKAAEIHKENAKNATKQATDYAVGNMILFIIKPIYYELTDSFKNGIQEGVGASSGAEALKIRFGRAKDYVIKNTATFLGDNAWDFVKGFISSLFEGIISLFVGIFKQVLKVIKEGIKIFVESAKVLFGKDSQNMSQSEKGDAIIKIIGGSVIGIAGIGIEALLNKIGIGEPWSIILSTMLSGIAATLFMYLLNKADLFSVKAEKRRDRIIEIFDERIKDIEEAANNLDIVAVETLQNQKMEFEVISTQIDEGIKNNNISIINAGLYRMAEFMNVNLPYSNTDEFCKYMDSEEVLVL